MEKNGDNDGEERIGILAAILGGAALFSVIVANVGVVARYVFAYSLPSVEEMLRYLFIWLIFIGSALSFGEGGLISITMLEELLSSRPFLRLALGIAQNLSFLVFSLASAWTGWKMLAMQFEFSETSVALEINMGWITLGVAIGYALMALYSVRNIYRVLRKRLASF